MACEELCERRKNEECKKKPFKKLPGAEYCWACASEEEKEKILEMQERKNLKQAHSSSANLEGAKMEGAKLYKAIIREIRGGRGLQAYQFEKGIGDTIEHREEVYRELAAY